MTGKKDKDACEKDGFCVLFQHIAQSQQDIRDHTEHKADRNHPCRIGSVGVGESENDKAEASEPLEHDGACKTLPAFFKDAVGGQ